MVSFTYVLAGASFATTITAGPLAMLASPVISNIGAVLGNKRDTIRGQSSLWERDDALDSILFYKRENADVFESCARVMQTYKGHTKMTKFENGTVILQKMHPVCIAAVNKYNASPKLKDLEAKHGLAHVDGPTQVTLNKIDPKILAALDGNAQA